ncbi:hypothetical protein VM99_02410 [Pseudomonas chlororaphis]|uniref:Uncharacterized protein n=1 Tax=Pseudomonas chlororaphis TaxID=587753 RepID=A0A0G3G6S2_9PSED|nr:hypothetical protein VM99_02410 [Pseudomonas chlororaphis]
MLQPVKDCQQWTAAHERMDFSTITRPPRIDARALQGRVAMPGAVIVLQHPAKICAFNGRA